MREGLHGSGVSFSNPEIVGRLSVDGGSAAESQRKGQHCGLCARVESSSADLAAADGGSAGCLAELETHVHCSANARRLVDVGLAKALA